ncbi:hypothetical protein R1flu_004368 [Riccia fluitans]|uniref:PB1 domain-containing protein n=1 Tax=Riccia fluitans TaxID=41844 RepID=A0ABD1YT13_9MARC
MDSYVIKVVHEDETPCRFNFSSKAGGEELSLQELQTAIRNKLGLQSVAKIKVNYKDDLGEFVRMTSDEDLKDALLKQNLSPLILKVKLVESPPPPDPAPPKTPVSSSRWGWGSSLISKVRVETAASETISDARCNANAGEQSGPEEQHYEREAVSTSSSFQLVDHQETQSVWDYESNSGLDDEPGGGTRSKPAPKVSYKCYECGVNPIVGPWYMSVPIKKQGYAACIYHLCEDCFVLRSWRHSKTIQFKLIKECAECHQYKPDVRRYPFQGSITRQSSTGEDADSEDSNDILLCDWCFKGITHRVMDAENRSLSQLEKDSGSSRRSKSSGSAPPMQMVDLLPAD